MIGTQSFSSDDFTFRVPVSTPEGIDLSAATAEVVAQSMRGGSVIEGSIAMFGSAGAAEARGRFDDGAFEPGVYRVQVRVTLGDITQTVVEWQHTVSRSL